MNKKKINKIIAYATLCCALTTNIPNLVYAENSEVSEYKTTEITFIENSTGNNVNKNTKESPVTFVDSNFEATIRKSLSLSDDEPIYQSTLDNIGYITLYVSPNNINSLEDIGKFTNLRSLTIYDNENGLDLTSTKSLGDLTSVTLKRGTFNLSQLPETQITELKLEDAIVDNSLLESFTKLETFGYSMNENEELTNFDFVDNLAKITTLVNLKIDSYKDVNSELNKLTKLTNLEKLDISNFSDIGIDLNFVSGLSNLKSIYVWKCNPNTVEALNSLPLLENVELVNSSIANDHLVLMKDTLDRVNTANFSMNKITKVEGIDTIFKDKEIDLSNNFIDLTSEENKAFLDSKSEINMYPQQKITTRESGRSFLLNVDESFDTYALAIELIEKDGSSRLTIVKDEDIEYYIAYKDNDFLTITESNKLVGTKEGNATVHVRIKGTDGPSTSVTITVSTTSKIENTGVVVVKTVDESGETIGNNQVASTYEKGTQTIVAPSVNYYYPVEGESIYKDVEVASGSINEITFKYKRIDSGITDIGKVQVVYKDDLGREIADTEFKEYLSLTSHDINAKEIEGYTLKGNAVQTVSLTFQEPYKVVTFEYKSNDVETQKGSLTINCVNDETGAIISSKREDDLSLGSYTRTAETLEGYTLVGDSTKSVNLTDAIPNGVIEFRYKANTNIDGDGSETAPVTKGKITIKYIEKDTGNALLTEKVLNDLELKSHEISAEDIEGYELIGDSELTITLTEEKTSEEVTFTYKKLEDNNNSNGDNNENNGSGNENNGSGNENNNGNNTEDSESQAKTGTVIIYYVDSSTKTEIANKEVKTGLELKDQIFTAKEIAGFTPTTDSVKVTLSEDVTSREITFEYTNVVETDDSLVFTLTPSILRNYIDNYYSWSISSENFALALSNDVLSEILDKISDNVSISFNSNLFNEEAYNNATKKYNVNVLRTLSISENIPTLEDNTTVTLASLIPSLYANKELYLYKVTKDGDLSFVDSKTAIAIDNNEDNAMVSFDVDINELNETDFIISDSNLELSNNVESNTNNNESKDEEEEKDKLPDTSGSAGVLFGLSITSLLAGVKLRKKK